MTRASWFSVKAASVVLNHPIFSVTCIPAILRIVSLFVIFGEARLFPLLRRHIDFDMLEAPSRLQRCFGIVSCPSRHSSATRENFPAVVKLSRRL